MPSLAEIGVSIGIPPEALAELLELPIVADAIRVAGEGPSRTPNAVWKAVGRPTLYKDSSGLDLDPLYVELSKRRELAMRSDGQINLGRLDHSAGPITAGRLHKAETVARRRLEVIAAVDDLLERPHEPHSMQRARNYLGAELEKAKGAGEL